jgi:hypothetical protein
VKREMTVETSERYFYDTDRIAELHALLRPDPDQYGDDQAYAVFAYLYDSQFHADVFESAASGGMWPISDEEYDPDA